MPHRSLIFILAALSMLGALSIDAYLPALPAIALKFGVSLTAAQQTLTIYLLAFGFMTLFYGTLSDSFGRRSIILISLVLYGFSSLLAGMTTSLSGLMFFRLWQGFTAGAGTVVGRAMVGDLFRGAEAQRTMSYISMVFGLAPAIAPILGGWLQTLFGWRSIFWFIAAFTFVLGVVCWKLLPESLPVEKRHPFHFQLIVRKYFTVASHLAFMCRVLSTAMTFGGIVIYVSAAPAFVMTILHLGETEFAWLFVPLISGMTLGSLVAGKVSHRWSPTFTINVGFVIMTLSILASLLYCGWFEAKIPWVILPIFTYAFGMSLANPAMTVLALELFPHHRGLAASFQTFLFLLVFSLCSAVISPMLFDSAFHLALGVAGFTILSAIIWWIGMLVPCQVEEPECLGQPEEEI